MSIKPTYLNDELYDYLLANYSCDDEILMELKRKADERGLPSIYITPEQGTFIQVLLKAKQAKNILEIGTLAGYSAIVMARALPDDGHIITIEKSEKFANFAKEMIEHFGYSSKITVIHQNAREWVVENDMPEHFDFVFVDADKHGYRIYLDAITPMIKKSGIFAADNAFAFGHLLEAAPERNPNEIKSMYSFNQYFNNCPDYDTSLLPIGDGLLLGVKK